MTQAVTPPMIPPTTRPMTRALPRLAPLLAPVLFPVLMMACTPIMQPPEMSAIGTGGVDREIITPERAALAIPAPQAARYDYQQASLWNTGPKGLLGDRRAKSLGDLLTVSIEIDEQAEMKNTTSRAREGSEGVGMNAAFGLSHILDLDSTKVTPELDINSDSSFKGNGSTKRNEKLRLRVAATVVQVLPNGQLVIQGDQEVRVNNELRDLQVSGIVRPEDISRHNEIDYDRIAGARISYGGRGQLTTAQQPRYGQQITDQILPF
ncbi:flagellar basal body L-ring protein FlgH [Amaricoccus sp. W119]|uniref:flagellar basal body L-ring protein FlgH n=1 Tax=Amaricoccus sp. W119 TaxID=3391833 RepID=UPI0039A4761F